MTCICEIQAKDGRTGYLVFQNGALFNATYGKLNGERAALELFKFGRAKIKFRNPPKKEFPRKITISNSELLNKAGVT